MLRIAARPPPEFEQDQRLKRQLVFFYQRMDVRDEAIAQKVGLPLDQVTSITRLLGGTSRDEWIVRNCIPFEIEWQPNEISYLLYLRIHDAAPSEIYRALYPRDPAQVEQAWIGLFPRVVDYVARDLGNPSSTSATLIQQAPEYFAPHQRVHVSTVVLPRIVTTTRPLLPSDLNNDSGQLGETGSSERGRVRR